MVLTDPAPARPGPAREAARGTARDAATDGPDPADAGDPAGRNGATGYTTGQLVVGTAVLLVGAHVALRAWMLWPSWFYGDDYALLGAARDSDLGAGYLTEPYGGRFMPLGRLAMWVVADSGPLDWHAAALLILLLVALADLACVWMLLELFGRRWGVLLPLSAYLGSAVVMPATMWWAASLDQLPVQAALCAAVAAWVRHLRTGRARWWVVTALVVAVGLVAFVKALLVLVVLAWITLAHFATGGPWRRVRDVVRRHRAGVVVLVAGSVGFLVWYLATIPSIVTDEQGDPVALDLAGVMLGRALPVGLLGGPWRWGRDNLPVAPADPPTWTVVVSWVVIVAAVVVLALRRRRTGRVWALLAVYAGLAYALLLATRAPLVGGDLGFEYRYLTDVVPVAALCLGLATLRARDAAEPTEPRPDPALRLPVWSATRLPVAVAVVLAVSGTASSVGYARLWHTDHASHTWFDTVRLSLAGTGSVDVADASVRPEVVSGLVSPYNLLSRLLPQAGLDVAFPDVSTRLAHVDADGRVTQAFVLPVIAGEPGPADGCGHRLGAEPGARTLTVPMEREVPAGVYWLRIPYLASQAVTIDVEAGSSSGAAELTEGLGSVFVNLADGATAVTVSIAPRDAAATVCLGDLEAGPLAEGPPW